MRTHPVSYKELMVISQAQLSLDLSGKKISDYIHETLQSIQEQLRSKPYTQLLILSDNGFNEHLAPLHKFTDYFTQQDELVFFLAQLPTAIQKIKFADIIIELDKFWAVYLFNQLQIYAKKRSLYTTHWLHDVNQEVWSEKSAISLLNDEMLPKTITLRTIQILEQLCLSTLTSFSLLCASWINKGLVSKTYYNPNGLVAKSYYQQALHRFSQNFEEGSIKEDQLSNGCLINLGLCAQIKTFDDLDYFKRLLGQINPYDILAIDIHDRDTLAKLQRYIPKITVECYLVLMGSPNHLAEIYQTLLPKLPSNIILYVHQAINLEIAEVICQSLNSSTPVEMSAYLNEATSQMLLEKLKTQTLAPCSFHNFEPLIEHHLEQLTSKELIAIPIKDSPYQSNIVIDKSNVLQTRLPHIQYPSSLRLPFYLNPEELTCCLEHLKSDSVIIVDNYTSVESVAVIIKHKQCIRLDKYLHPSHINYLFSFDLPVKIYLAAEFPIELAILTCEHLTKDSTVMIEGHTSEKMISTLAQHMPAHSKIEVCSEVNSVALQILQQSAKPPSLLHQQSMFNSSQTNAVAEALPELETFGSQK